MLIFILVFTITICENLNILRVALNNDRDEVYDIINVVYLINRTELNLNDWNLITRIKDDQKIFYEKNENIPSFLFTISININNLELIENSLYQVEGILKNKINGSVDTFSYTFKKIIKTNRQVRNDKYGRIFINDELFFPLGIFTRSPSEEMFNEFNKTHLNFIMSYSQQV